MVFRELVSMHSALTVEEDMNDMTTAANLEDDPWLPLMAPPRQDSSPDAARRKRPLEHASVTTRPIVVTVVMPDRARGTAGLIRLGGLAVLLVGVSVGGAWLASHGFFHSPNSAAARPVVLDGVGPSGVSIDKPQD